MDLNLLKKREIFTRQPEYIIYLFLSFYFLSTIIANYDLYNLNEIQFLLSPLIRQKFFKRRLISKPTKSFVLNHSHTDSIGTLYPKRLVNFNSHSGRYVIYRQFNNGLYNYKN